MSDDQDPIKQPLKEDVFFRHFAENQSEIFSYILTLVPGSADAEDIFQETSSVLWRKFEEFRLGTSFSAWGCRIAWYIILEHRRQSARSPISYSSETLKLLSESYSASRRDKQHRLEYLSDCLKSLSDKERQLVQMRYNQALSINDMAQRFGKSINLIYKSLAKMHYFLFECVRRNMAADQQS
jgi:RNA polymerase sigma-70 factor (ECF subfamily)